ncbi:membrane protein [Frondihabitans sucicola]|uniref:Membrane protein n=1 Tax=Frondihabitans sucicola TaxID=1268041 RepID=A0ABM8GRI5_9MICO|nr:DUF2156 domain-containing protein [Frondihabitans sucicola]BDZ50914.1 membrane protein [Frondihabitans sucicola]
MTTTAGRGDATPGLVARSSTTLVRFARDQPVSVIVSAVLVLVAVLSGSVVRGPSDALRDLIGAGVDDRSSAHAWIATLGSVLFSGSLPELVTTVIAVLVLVGAAERRIGWQRTIVAYLATGVVATVIGVAVQAIGIGLGEVWALTVAYDTTLHPFTPALGTIMAASAFAGPLWRRRIRLIGFASITTFLLYDGHPSGLYALAGAAAGLLLGRIMRPTDRHVERPWTRSSHHEARVLLSTLVAITALGPVVTLLTRSPIGALAPLGELFGSALPLRHTAALCRFQADTDCTRDLALGGLHGPGTIALSLLPLLTLLVCASLIRRGRRLAVRVAAIVNALLAVLAAVYYGILPLTAQTTPALPGHLVERLFLALLSVVAPLSVAVVLVVFLHHFTVRTPRVVARQFGWTVGSTFVALVVFYVSTGYLGRDRFTPAISFPGLLLSAPERFIPVGFLGLHRLGPVPDDGPLRVVFESVGPVFWLVVIAALLVATSRSTTQGTTVRARGDVDRILRRGVTGALSHMATWEGNSYWFTHDGQAAVAYRVIGNTAITTGDPLCSADRTADVILEFARWCDDHGLSPVFYSVRDEIAPVFRDLGWALLPVGEETVLHPATFTMKGKKWQDVRSSINRAEKLDVRAEWTTYGALRPAITQQIDDISEQWVAEKDLPELGFTLGGLDELMDRDVALMLAVDSSDRVLAVTSWLPSYRDGEVIGRTLDFMRRRPDSMNGVMEFVIASAALRGRDDGLEFLSLSGAPLATADGSGGAASQTERLLGFLARVLEPAYGFQSLLTFKQKFQPEFVPLVMAYPDPLELPTIGTALARAYLPELSVRQVPKLLRQTR